MNELMILLDFIRKIWYFLSLGFMVGFISIIIVMISLIIFSIVSTIKDKRDKINK